MHGAGMARLHQLVREAKLPRMWQRQVTAAATEASWSLDTRIKVCVCVCVRACVRACVCVCVCV
jgi:hypothetical protein